MSTIKRPTVIGKDSISSSEMLLSTLCSNDDQSENNYIQIYPLVNEDDSTMKLTIGQISYSDTTDKPDYQPQTTLKQYRIYTSQAIIDAFTGTTANNNILVKNSILINKNPEQSTTKFNVDINKISTTNVIIDSDVVENEGYTFERKQKLITNTLDNKISVSANQGTVYIEPEDDATGDNPATLTLYGVNETNTGTTNLKTIDASIGKANTIELKTQRYCAIYYIYNGLWREGTGNFPYNTTHPFTYTRTEKSSGKSYDVTCMYEPGAAYSLGTDEYDQHGFFTFNKQNQIEYIVGASMKQIDSNNSPTSLFVNFNILDSWG